MTSGAPSSRSPRASEGPTRRTGRRCSYVCTCGGRNGADSRRSSSNPRPPTGIVVACQNERSQLQNKETAMKILRARLLERQVREQEEAQAKERGEMRSADWGSQIRSYILHPYTLVKDHRTGVEIGDPV